MQTPLPRDRGCQLYPFDTFTENAKRVLTFAQEEAERAHHSYIGTEHLLLGLLREENGLALKSLNSLGVEIGTVRSRIEAVLASNQSIRIQQILPTSRVKEVLEIAFDEARQAASSGVGTVHILLGLLVEGKGIAAQILGDLGANLEAVREYVYAATIRGETETTKEGGGGQSWPGYPSHPAGSRAPNDPSVRVIGAVVSRAVALAGHRGEALDTEHFLLALASRDMSLARDILARHGLTGSAIEKILDDRPRGGHDATKPA